MFRASGVATMLLFLAMPVVHAQEPNDEQIKRAVVKVFSTVHLPDPNRPWAKANPQEATGTGVVIEGNRILTNAHVVLYARPIFIQPHQSGDKLPATVAGLSAEMDMAVLKVDDESFFKDRAPLPLSAGLPNVRDSVLAYGYPTGGTSLSVTKGIVSRIEFVPYHQGESGLRIQIDAGINPGNSGGPAMLDGKMVGLVFARLNQGDNIGYIIPIEEIQTFLTDVADGRYDGKFKILDSFQTLENDALRAFLAAPPSVSGVVVQQPVDREADYPLKEWDIVTAIGEQTIDSTGMVNLPGNLRLQFGYMVAKMEKDGAVPLKVFRKGTSITVNLKLTKKAPTVIRTLDGAYPSYFICGPIAFMPVYLDFINPLDRVPGASALLAARKSPLMTRRSDRPAFEGEELVTVASNLFPHRISKGYGRPFFQVIESINRVKIKNFTHLIETLRDSKDRFVEVKFAEKNSETMVFDRKQMLDSTEEILEENGIRRQGTEDAMALWEKKAQ